jgi:sec-independent protein translocase protein TatC
MKKILTNILLFPYRLIWYVISLPFRFLGWLFQPIVKRFKNNPVYIFLTEDPGDRPMGDAFSDAIEQPMSILDHLIALRIHIFRSMAAIVIAVGFSFYFTQQFIDFLAQPVGGLQNLQAIEVTESISVFMRVALLSGIALASPWIAFEFWLFIAPGLMPRTRQIGLLAIPLAIFFFVGGMAFAYFAMLPTALPFLLDFLGISVKLRPDSYFGFVTSIMFWIGVCFEFPLVIFALSAIGLVKPSMLLKYWRIAVIIIAILSAAITPTVDPVNMALVMGPMILLYFLSILFGWLAQLGRGKESQPSQQAPA